MDEKSLWTEVVEQLRERGYADAQILALLAPEDRQRAIEEAQRDAD